MKNTNFKIICVFIIFLFILLGFSTSYAADSLTVSGPNTVKVNEKIQLKAEAIFFKNTVEEPFQSSDVTSEATWTSSDTTIATVDNTGSVTGVKAGSVKITATYREPGTDSLDVQDSLDITVTAVEHQWTDVSNVKFTIPSQASDFSNRKLLISGLSPKEGSKYYVWLSNSSEKPADLANNGPSKADSARFSVNDSCTELNSFIDDYLEKNGDIYLWFYEEITSADYSKEYKELISAKKVERPALSSLGLRMQAFFFNTHTSLFVKEFRISDERKMHIKIGNITDNEILRAIRDGKSGSFYSLLNYAKSATNPLYENSFTTGNSSSGLASITANLPINNQQFYYVYMYLEDENGKYYPLEDIGLYQGNVGETVGKNLCDYYTQKDRFNWDALGSEAPGTSTPNPNPASNPTPNPSDPTATKTPIPNTGKGTLIMGFIVILASGMFAYMKSQEYKEIK